MKNQLLFLSALTLGASSIPAHADLVTKTVEYSQGGQALEGYLAYDDSFQGKRPGILVTHQWMGLTDYEKMRADMLAKLGYVAFAVDIYGKGIRPKNREEAAAQAGKFRADRPLLRARMQAGVAALSEQPLVDTTKLAAIGYCFGGGATLELARSGADLQGFVSFHGNLDTPDTSLAKNIKGKLLVMNGAIDPNIKPESISAFHDEMEAAHVDYQFINYSGAVHSFTEKDAGDDITKGSAYNANADKRSWQTMQNFFNEIFEGK